MVLTASPQTPGDEAPKLARRLRRLALLALIASAISAAPASASTWQQSLDGVTFGWEDRPGTQYDHAWASATDQTLEQLGARAVTDLACRAVTKDAPRFTTVCEDLVRPVVSLVIDTVWGDTAGKGHWVEYYPHLSPWVFHGKFYF
jgi:hypothetical protein